VKELFQLLNVHAVNVRQADIPSAQPSASEVEMAIETLKSCKSPGNDQIPAEQIQAEGKKMCSEIHKLIM
jgi:hypothetical protein